MANQVLFDPKHTSSSYALVIYSPQDDVADDELVMGEWIAALAEYQLPRSPTKHERLLASHLESQRPFFQPLKIPNDVTDGAEDFVIGVRVERSLLPRKAITKPYLNIAVLEGDDGGVLMLPNAKKKRKSG